MDKIVWIDIETDKLDPVAAQPIQVACIATDRMLPDVALETLTDFFAAHSTWKRTSKRSGNGYTTCEIGGHNIAMYDAIVLANWYKRLDEYCPAATWVTGPVDTMQWARAVEFARGERWEGGFSLKALCKRFGVTLENEHDALVDVKATVELARVLKRMTVGETQVGVNRGYP